MINRFTANNPQLDSPASNQYLVTPSDSQDLPFLPRAFYATSDGDVVLRARGVDVTYPVSAGAVLPVRAERVLATGTTANVIAWD